MAMGCVRVYMEGKREKWGRRKGGTCARNDENTRCSRVRGYTQERDETSDMVFYVLRRW